MTSPESAFPSTLAECHAMMEGVIAAKEATLEINVELQATVEQLRKSNAEQQAALEALGRELALLKRSMFGQRRERFEDPRQAMLFDSAVVGEQSGGEQQLIAEDEAEEQKAASRNRRGRVRRIIPECLPREKRVQELNEEDIPEALRDQPMRRFEKKVGEFIEYEPPRLTLVEEYVQVAAVDNQDATETTMVSAKSEPRLLSGLPGNSLLAGIATWRFADHLPYYRLEEILDRYQLRLDRATQCRWMIETAKRVQPLVDLMRSLCLSSSVVQADETPVKMLAPGQGKTDTTYLWTILGGRDHPYTTFSFTEDRSRAGPDEFFRDYEGTLVCDAYTCYESLSARSQERIVLAACHVHARRKFEALHKLAATEHTSTAMGYFQRLFDLEDQLASLSDEDRLAHRQRLAKPLMEQFKAWLDETVTGMRPKHELRGAIEYMTKRWESFTRFLTSGAIPVHNNASEQAVKLSVIGKKAWLFFGSPNGGHTAATLYSLTASCRRLQIDPHKYLCDLFRRLPGCDPSDPQSLMPLLPDRWLKAHPDALLEIRVDESKAKADRKRRKRAERKRALGRAQRKKR